MLRASLLPLLLLRCALGSGNSLLGLCPEGWGLNFRGYCEAPLSYAGFCGRVLDIAGADEKTKDQIGRSCGLEWPRPGRCEENFDLPCPRGWWHDRGVCYPPLGYSGHCRAFLAPEADLKRELAASCGPWPCLADTAGDAQYLSACPTGWSLIDGICVAPQIGKGAYRGPCVPFADVSSLSVADKTFYAAMCEVIFGGGGGEAAVDNSCNLYKECPLGWLSLGHGFCYGANYTGPCRPVIGAHDVEALGQQALMEMCSVEYQCDFAVPGARADVVVHSPAVSLSGAVDAEGRVASWLAV